MKIPEVVKAVDRVVYWVFKNVLGKKKHLSYRYLFQRLRYVRSVGRDLAKRPVDRIVFENHPTLLMSLRMRGNGERYEGRYFYHVHNILSGFYGCEKEMLGCRKVLGVSGYALREIAKLAQGRFSASRLAMLRNKVDEGIFTGMLGEDEALALRIKHGIPDGARVVLFGGRLCPEKGALELVEAFAKVETRGSRFCSFSGPIYYGSKMKSEYEMKLSSAAESFGGDRIIFTGFVKHEEMPSYYADGGRRRCPFGLERLGPSCGNRAPYRETARRDHRDGRHSRIRHGWRRFRHLARGRRSCGQPRQIYRRDPRRQHPACSKRRCRLERQVLL